MIYDKFIKTASFRLAGITKTRPLCEN